jgi:hypothetical protein
MFLLAQTIRYNLHIQMQQHCENVNINGLHCTVGNKYSVDKEAAFFYETRKLTIILT